MSRLSTFLSCNWQNKKNFIQPNGGLDLGCRFVVGLAGKYMVIFGLGIILFFYLAAVIETMQVTM
jgi:hypothetical protein